MFVSLSFARGQSRAAAGRSTAAKSLCARHGRAVLGESRSQTVREKGACEERAFGDDAV
jgi:hypothetical protein